MLDAIRSIFGAYTPLVNQDGSAIIGISGVNFEYVAEVVLFSICLICVFKLLGVVLRHI